MPEPAQVLLGFDYGARRIGIAAGSTVTGTAGPRPAAAVLSGAPDWAAIDRAVRELCPGLLVVGIPYNADGGLGPMAGAARSFGDALRKRFGLPVEYVDERYSSIEAGAALAARRGRGERRRVRREDIDSVAAAVILERWLAARPKG